MEPILQFEQQENGDYKVIHYNGVHIGDLSRDGDLNYNFWLSEPYRGGFWPGYILRAISDKLDALNKPIDDEFNAWCEQHPPENLSNEPF